MTHKPTLTQADLVQFIGTEYYYRHPIAQSIHYTDGVKYMGEFGHAYWLIDEIALVQTEKPFTDEPFQHWTLTVNPDRSATLVCDDGNHNIVFEKEITFTDFPLDKIDFFFSNNVLMLPSEW